MFEQEDECPVRVSNHSLTFYDNWNEVVCMKSDGNRLDVVQIHDQEMLAHFIL